MLKKFIKPEHRSGTSSDSSVTTDNKNHKDLDKKLVHSLNSKKIPSPKQLKHLGKVLDKKQKRQVAFFATLILISTVALGVTFYLKNFVTVPREGGTYTTGLVGAPQFINPLLAQTNDVDSDISRLIFSGLLKYDKELQLINDLASYWETNEEKTEYTFHLKEGVKWHDGEDFNADDVVFTFQSIKDPDFKSPLLISFRGVEIEKIDELTVRFTLPEAYPSFLEVLTVGILPEHVWGEIPPINSNLTKYNLKPVGTGPWKFAKFFDDELGNIKSYVIVPNQDYYGPKPYIQEITFKFYPDFETATSALKNNSIEGISFLPKELKSSLLGEKNINFYSFYLPQYTAIFFNQKENELLKDKNIRRSLAMSIDKPKILTEALQLEGEIINGPILPVDVVTDDEKNEFNPNLANQLLDDDGWEKITVEEYDKFLAEQLAQEQKDEEETSGEESTDEANATSTEEVVEETTPSSGLDQQFVRKKDDQILEITLTTVNQPETALAAQLIKKSWEEIGFKVNLNLVEGAKISREIIKPRNYEILLFGIIVGSNPDPYPFWHSSQVQDPGLNLAQFANREADKLLEDARKSIDYDEQIESYQRFQDILTAEIPAIFLYNPTYTYVADKKIKGIGIDRIIIPADRFNNLEDWFIKTKKQLKTSFN